jgi:hypothetical protein
LTRLRGASNLDLHEEGLVVAPVVGVVVVVVDPQSLGGAD